MTIRLEWYEGAFAAIIVACMFISVYFLLPGFSKMDGHWDEPHAVIVFAAAAMVVGMVLMAGTAALYSIFRPPYNAWRQEWAA